MNREESVKENNKTPIARTITGGVVGATIGYLATPDNSKKLFAYVKNSQLKEKSLNAGKATKEKVSELTETGKKKTKDAYQRVKNAPVFTGGDNSDEVASHDVTTELVNEENYLELKEENIELQKRLKDLEKKLSKIADSTEENNAASQKQSTQQANRTEKKKRKTMDNKPNNTKNEENKHTSENTENSESAGTSVSNNDDTNADKNEE